MHICHHQQGHVCLSVCQSASQSVSIFYQPPIQSVSQFSGRSVSWPAIQSVGAYLRLATFM